MTSSSSSWLFLLLLRRRGRCCGGQYAPKVVFEGLSFGFRQELVLSSQDNAVENVGSRAQEAQHKRRETIERQVGKESRIDPKGPVKIGKPSGRRQTKNHAQLRKERQNDNVVVHLPKPTHKRPILQMTTRRRRRQCWYCWSRRERCGFLGSLWKRFVVLIGVGQVVGRVVCCKRVIAVVVVLVVHGGCGCLAVGWIKEIVNCRS